MSNLTQRGHSYETPPGMPPDYNGPGECCGYGRWAPQHHGYGPATYSVEITVIAALFEAINDVRDIAAERIGTTTDLTARAGFHAILNRLAALQLARTRDAA